MSSPSSVLQVQSTSRPIEGRLLERIALLEGIGGTEIAARVGRHPSAISQLYRRSGIQPVTAQRFLEAVVEIASERRRDLEALELGRLMLAGAAGQ